MFEPRSVIFVSVGRKQRKRRMAIHVQLTPHRLLRQPVPTTCFLRPYLPELIEPCSCVPMRSTHYQEGIKQSPEEGSDESLRPTHLV